MKTALVDFWTYAAAGWVGVIFFSSTSLASKWCEEAFAWASALVFGREAMQRPSFSFFHLFADKGLHVTLFLVLALLLSKALPSRRFRAVKILTIGLAVGSCSEFLQRFFPGRDPAIRDVLINVAGTGLGLVLSAIAATKAAETSASTKEVKTVA